MRCISYVWIIILCTFFKISNGQNNHPTKQQIVNLFKNSISQQSKNGISVGSNAWVICNKDSAFFKSDTIILQSNINYFYQIGDCCDFIEWIFYKQDAYLQKKLQVCNEPASASANADNLRLILTTQPHDLVLTTILNGRMMSKFKVLRVDNVKLASNISSTAITLKRIHP